MPELLHPFQITAAEWMAARLVCLLLDEMGLGKTATTIRASDLIKARLILVICPAIATMVWGGRVCPLETNRSIKSRSSDPVPTPNKSAAM